MYIIYNNFMHKIKSSMIISFYFFPLQFGIFSLALLHWLNIVNITCFSKYGDSITLFLPDIKANHNIIEFAQMYLQICLIV